MWKTAHLNDLQEEGGSIAHWPGENLQQNALSVAVDQHTQLLRQTILLLRQIHFIYIATCSVDSCGRISDTAGCTGATCGTHIPLWRYSSTDILVVGGGLRLHEVEPSSFRGCPHLPQCGEDVAGVQRDVLHSLALRSITHNDEL